MNSLFALKRHMGALTRSGRAPMARRAYTTEQPLFKKILIANRGEIALRVMRTARKMGIKTVAVFSEPDRHALHVRQADEAVHIGPALSSESYLRIDRIIAACKATGADAVHPGYGFLSENAAFVQACEKEGITFIGPPTSAMEALGDKIMSKKIAKEAGVTIVPGFVGEVKDEKDVLRIANEIGYPVMVKASAGGGGKGMRIAWNDQEAAEGYRLSRQEAKAAFGDDRILIEKFIDSPRHIEFQVLADGQGGAIYLPERECSIQRRNQKVIEEAPSPFLTPEVRHRMGEEACALARAVNYKNTGTVEFLIDPQENYYFLEMNTRLQVEHPITEEVTGIDIVEHMIRIAAGQKLALKQSDVQIKGWAIESRLYAEDPLRGFLPSIGKLTRYQVPKVPGSDEDAEEVMGHAHHHHHHHDHDHDVECMHSSSSSASKWLRIDSGIEEGSEISIYYDPLISKLVTSAPTRPQAIAYMRYALDSYIIRGLNHNMCFLRDVMDNPRFQEGTLSTNFIPSEYPDGFHGHVLTPVEKNNLVATAAAMHFTRMLQHARIEGGRQSSYHPSSWSTYSIRIVDAVGVDDAPQTVDVMWMDEGVQVMNRATGEYSQVDLSQWAIDTTLIEVALQSKSLQDMEREEAAQMIDSNGNNYNNNNTNGFTASSADYTDEFTPLTLQLVSVQPHGYTLQYIGTAYQIEIMTPRERELAVHMPKPKKVDLSKSLVSPMAGHLVSVAVQVGQRVSIGQELAIVEAMKMQNVLRALRDGVIKAVRSTPGSSVALDEVLIEFE